MLSITFTSYWTLSVNFSLNSTLSGAQGSLRRQKLNNCVATKRHCVVARSRVCCEPAQGAELQTTGQAPAGARPPR